MLSSYEADHFKHDRIVQCCLVIRLHFIRIGSHVQPGCFASFVIVLKDI